MVQVTDLSRVLTQWIEKKAYQCQKKVGYVGENKHPKSYGVTYLYLLDMVLRYVEHYLDEEQLEMLRISIYNTSSVYSHLETIIFDDQDEVFHVIEEFLRRQPAMDEIPYMDEDKVSGDFDIIKGVLMMRYVHYGVDESTAMDLCRFLYEASVDFYRVLNKLFYDAHKINDLTNSDFSIFTSRLQEQVFSQPQYTQEARGSVSQPLSGPPVRSGIDVKGAIAIGISLIIIFIFIISAVNYDETGENDDLVYGIVEASIQDQKVDLSNCDLEIRIPRGWELSSAIEFGERYGMREDMEQMYDVDGMNVYSIDIGINMITGSNIIVFLSDNPPGFSSVYDYALEDAKATALVEGGNITDRQSKEIHGYQFACFTVSYIDRDVDLYYTILDERMVVLIYTHVNSDITVEEMIFSKSTY